MNKNIKRYAELKEQERAIQLELKELKADVMNIVSESDGEKLETELGLFELRAGRKTWKYSDELILKDSQVKEKIKSMKKQEELSGAATLEKSPTNLVFTARKGS